jgi:hypothetical protein
VTAAKDTKIETAVAAAVATTREDVEAEVKELNLSAIALAAPVAAIEGAGSDMIDAVVAADASVPATAAESSVPSTMESAERRGKDTVEERRQEEGEEGGEEKEEKEEEKEEQERAKEAAKRQLATSEAEAWRLSALLALVDAERRDLKTAQRTVWKSPEQRSSKSASIKNTGSSSNSCSSNSSTGSRNTVAFGISTSFPRTRSVGRSSNDSSATGNFMTHVGANI